MIKQTFTQNRRNFIRSAVGTASAAIFPLIIPSSILGRNGSVSPNSRITIGCIGVGDRGTYLLESVLQSKDTRVVAVCDVKSHCREKATHIVNSYYDQTDCASYNEHEKIVLREDIDACVIASCDHWHALHSLEATQAGKHVYCEKPLSVSVAQNAVLRSAVRSYNTVFQFGTQQRSDAKFRQACEIVRNMRIGTLKRINVWSPASESGGPTTVVDVPPYLDYERWLGPAPFVPYTEERDSNKWWWFIEDYAIGFIAGWGIHPMDIALWGGGDLLRTGSEIKGEGTFPNEGVCNTCTAWQVELRYDSGVIIDYRSQPAPEEWLKRYEMAGAHGTAFEGTDGWVAVNRNKITVSHEELLSEQSGDGKCQLYRSSHHMYDFIESIKKGTDPASPIETAFDADSVCHMCDIAVRLKQPLRWNSTLEQFENNTEANNRLIRPIRSPWDKSLNA